jgi:hypothetical protein
LAHPSRYRTHAPTKHTDGAPLSGYVVRKPMGRIIIVLCYLGMAALFFDEAMSKNKHWGFWAAGIASAIGILFFLDLVCSSTTFAMDLLEQRSFHGSVRRLRYADIEKAELVDVGKGVALRLLSIDGTKINVSGNRDEVIKAKELLFSKIPHAFKKWASTD